MKVKRFLCRFGVLSLLMAGICIPAIAQGPIGEFEGQGDVGAVAAPGDASFSNGEYEVRGSGADIWGTADEFYFVHKRVSGPFRISASLDGYNESSSNEWSKGGIMIRNNLTAGSSYAYAMIRLSDAQYDSQWRSAQESSAANLGLVGTGSQDGRVILERLGNTINAYYIDITTNQPVLHASISVEMEDEVYVGLAVTSHDDGNYSLGIFTNVQIDLLPFEVSRNVPTTKFQAGKTITGVSLIADIRDGTSNTITITETPPAGWTVTNINTSAGTYTVNADGSIVWSLTNATGSPTLTYDITAPANALVANWSGSAVSGNNNFTISGVTTLDPMPPLFTTNNVLAVGVWNDNSGSSDLAVTAELVDNNGVIYVQDTSATGGWPSSTVFKYKVVFFEDGSGGEEPGWQDRDFDDSDWESSTDTGFTIGYGGNAAENGETLLIPFEETVYTRSIFDAVNYESITEITIKLAADDEAVAWLNGVFIGFTASGTSDRGETARDYVYDTTIAGGQGGLENGSNPSVYTGSGTRVFTFPVNLVESDSTSVGTWSLY